MINYEKIPDWWAVCPNEACKFAEICLRQQACRQMPERIKKWTSILPNAVGEGDCGFFLKYEKVTMAKGIGSVYKNVEDKYARTNIRKALTAFLGSKGTYYRYKDGERLVSPQLQQDIRDIVHRFAPNAEVAFDETFEDYDFTQS